MFMNIQKLHWFINFIGLQNYTSSLLVLGALAFLALSAIALAFFIFSASDLAFLALMLKANLQGALPHWNDFSIKFTKHFQAVRVGPRLNRCDLGHLG